MDTNHRKPTDRVLGEDLVAIKLENSFDDDNSHMENEALESYLFDDDPFGSADLATADTSDADPGDYASPHDEDDDTPESGSSKGNKRSSKKRKSWGQVLPEPKTCLPPRLVAC